MLVIGVCGQSSSELSARLSRHISGVEFVSFDSAVQTSEVPILAMVHAASKMTRQGKPDPSMVLLAVDPPPENSDQYRPFQNFLTAKADRQVLPFHLNTTPESRASIGTWTTYQQLADHIIETTGEYIKVADEVKDDTVLTQQISANIEQWHSKEIIYRSLASSSEREIGNLGDGVVIVVTAVKGGSGKSTIALIAANLLTNWGAETSSSTLLIDANLGQPVISGLTWEIPRKDIRWAMTQMEEGMPPDDVLAEAASPIAAGARSSGNYGSHGKIHAVISSLRSAGRTIRYQPEAMYELVTAAARKYDYVIVDAPPIDPVVSETLGERFVLPAADKVLFVCDSDFSSSENAGHYYDQITYHVQGLGDHIGFVLNKENEHREFNMQIFSEMLSAYGRETVPPWIIGSVPYIAKLKQEFNEGVKGVPEISEIDNAIARILETVLGEHEGAILSPEIANKGFLRGLFRR